MFHLFATIEVSGRIGPRAVALTGDGSRVAYGQGCDIVVRERAFQQDLYILCGHAGLAEWVALSHSAGRALA